MNDARSLLIDLFNVGVESADPAVCVPPLLPEPPTGRTIVVAAGKAAASMARAVETHWAGPLEGIAVTRYGHGVDCGRIEVIEAAHPVPDDRGEVAAARLLRTVSGLGEEDLVLCLISGGGSALLGLAADGLSLADKKAVNKQLLASGAPIGAMNTVRKHLSAIKGGRLAEAAHPARVITIGISDVPGDDPSVIASGPTVPDATTLADARAIVERYRIDLPDHVRAHLDRPDAETPKPGDPVFERTSFHMASRPADMVEAVAAEARHRGFEVISLGADIEGEAREVGVEHARYARRIAEERHAGAVPLLIVSGGETTVTLKGEGGRGGRNTEYLLALGLALDGDPRIHALACDTDGIDGVEDNAGAVLDPQTLARARDSGLDPAERLEANDAYRVFESSGDLIVTGPTLTNVNDLRLILIA
ncbi:glycerate kinase type-2 family protein [Pararhizobium haloflavum]|uniref:glycerate kinase type-2 family protein n=1 Tax=Pararhizobium haloflavum TaxID=2037914 RepID=UPI000C17D8EF|nr:glycerate kinase [Pararhizobium haloflavum]